MESTSGPDRSSLARLLSSPAVAYGSLAIAIILYGAVVTDFRGQFFRNAPYGFTFNSMLEHLLRGQFDVDAAAVDGEGFIRNGKVYAYFGIFPALLRLLFLPFVDLRTVDVSVASCFIAVTVSGVAKFGALRCLQRALPAGRTSAILLAVALCVAHFSGAQLQFLAPNIYIEVDLWSGAFAALFLWCTARGAFGAQGYTPSLLAALAFCAGAALLTRVSTGLGLYLATVFVAAYLGVSRWRRRERATRAGGLNALLWQPMMVRPMIVLAGFALVCAIVNYERWGNPLTFTDLHRNIYYLTGYPDRIARLDRYGEFNIRRLWYGIMYYFFPIWMWHDSNGQFLFNSFRSQFLQWIDLLPSSFFLSDPLLLLACSFGLRSMAKRSSANVDTRPFRALALGLAVPPALMLIAMSMAFRYRIEFYPIFELCALLGLYAFARGLVRDRRELEGRSLFIILALALCSVAASIVLVVLHKAWPIGVSEAEMSGANLFEFYAYHLRPHP